MADLSVDQQTPNIDDLISAVGDLSAPDHYVPPTSGTFRTSKYPGFWTAGQTPSNTPNAISGDNPVAAPSVGEFGYVAPAADTGSSAATGLSSITRNPVGEDPSEGADQRQANAIDNARTTGFDTDPDDALKAATIAGSFTGPTGLLGLGLQTGLNLAGVPTPSLSLEHGVTLDSSNPFDFKSNDNQRPGYDDAFKKAQQEVLAENPRYTDPNQLTQRMHDRTRDILDRQDTATRNDTLSKAQTSTTGFRGTLGANAGVAPAAPAAPEQDVTAANRQTGFQPTTPSDRSVGGGATPTGGTPDVTPNAPGAVSTTTPAGPGAYNGQGRGANGGGGSANGNGGGGFGHDSAGNANAGRRGFAHGGTIVNEIEKLSPAARHKVAQNHKIMSQVAGRLGLTLPQLIAQTIHRKDNPGARARLAAHMMDLAHGQISGKAHDGAAKGDASKSWQSRAFANAHGQLHQQLGIPVTEKIPEAKLKWAARQPGKLGQQARAALNAQGISYAGGGEVMDPAQDDQHQHDFITSNGKRAAAVPEAQRSGDDWDAVNDYRELHEADPEAAQADPQQDSRYNPPASATDPHGVVDGQPIMATPGEFMVQRDAAMDYSPGVKAAINDPAMASKINDALEQMLGISASSAKPTPDAQGADDQGADDQDPADDGTSDDSSGLGVLQPKPKVSSAMRGVPQPKSKLAQITRAS